MFFFSVFRIYFHFEYLLNVVLVFFHGVLFILCFLNYIWSLFLLLSNLTRVLNIIITNVTLITLKLIYSFQGIPSNRYHKWCKPETKELRVFRLLHGNQFQVPEIPWHFILLHVLVHFEEGGGILDGWLIRHHHPISHRQVC